MKNENLSKPTDTDNKDKIGYPPIEDVLKPEDKDLLSFIRRIIK
mgnify:CR=1 FL=1